MKGIESIPITVVSTSSESDATDMAMPLLHELAAMMDTLIESGDSNSIDLRRAPLDPKDRMRLAEVLGQGELSARVDCLGPTLIQETAITGVWWITHCDAQDRVLGEFIEVTTFPEILRSTHQEVRSGVTRLRRRLAEQTATTDPGVVAERLRALGLERAQPQQESPPADQQSE